MRPPSVPNDRVDASTTTLYRALEVAGRVRVRLVGASMRPLMREGASATVVRCTCAELRRGDVAVYARGDRIVAHLVRSVDRRGPVPCALGALDVEAPIEEGALLGRIEGLVVGTRSLPFVPRLSVRTLVLALDLALSRRTRWTRSREFS